MPSAYDYLLNGSLWNAFTTQMTTTMGAWFWVLIIIITDIALLIKLKKPIIPFTINFLLIQLFRSELPTTFYSALSIGSALILTFLLFQLFIKKPNPYENY